MPESALVPETVLELREQFSSPEQQRETTTIGMWIFLMTEVMLFGGLFVAYTVYKFSHPQAFDIGSSQMEATIGAINTIVLICSSLTMALAVYSAEVGKQKTTMLYLVLTIVIGAVFLALKMTEYVEHWHDHKVPAFWFVEHSPFAPQIQMFFVFYFVMTGLHALHMTIGIVVLSVLLFRSALGSFTAEYHTPIDMGGLYWHFIDVVWVFLYAIFYIPGLHLK